MCCWGISRFPKAFDTVDHYIVLDKLHIYDTNIFCTGKNWSDIVSQINMEIG